MQQTKNSDRTPLVAVLLEGRDGDEPPRPTQIFLGLLTCWTFVFDNLVGNVRLANTGKPFLRS